MVYEPLAVNSCLRAQCCSCNICPFPQMSFVLGLAGSSSQQLMSLLLQSSIGQFLGTIKDAKTSKAMRG